MQYIEVIVFWERESILTKVKVNVLAVTIKIILTHSKFLLFEYYTVYKIEENLKY